MEFIVKHRDGPARIGELTIEGLPVVTPNIFFVHTHRFTAPSFADVLITNTNDEYKKPTLKLYEKLFLPSKIKSKDELHVANTIVYPKDLPNAMHMSVIKRNKERRISWCVLPGNIEFIDEIY